MVEEETPPSPGSVITPSADQSKELFSGTAVYANKIYGTFSQLGVRLTFMEASPDGGERFRTAVFITMPDAASLRDLLERNVAKFEFSIEMVGETPPDEKKE